MLDCVRLCYNFILLHIYKKYNENKNRRLHSVRRYTSGTAGIHSHANSFLYRIFCISKLFGLRSAPVGAKPTSTGRRAPHHLLFFIAPKIRCFRGFLHCQRRWLNFGFDKNTLKNAPCGRIF